MNDKDHHDHHKDHDKQEQEVVQKMDMHSHEVHSIKNVQEGKHHQGAHVNHSGHEQIFRKKFWISLILSIPVLVFSPMIQLWLGYSMPSFPASRWITPVSAIAVFFYGGLPFLKMAIPELRNKQPGMMTLISLAISVAFIYSLAALFLPTSDTFFWELVTLIDIMLLGHWIEMRSIRQASGALSELAKMMPDTAERILSNGDTESVSVDKLIKGDIVLVRPGTSIPSDGEITEGESDVNEAMVTGESHPVTKIAGGKVIAGTINGNGSLRVKVLAIGDETALAGIMRLVEQAQQSKSNTQILADKAAGWLFFVALGVAVLTAVSWIIAVGFNVDVIARVATVLVIACPHALGLAVPLVVAITTALGAKNGILVRDRLALETARIINVVVFDKTGTLTKGEFGVVGIETVDGISQDEALGLTSAIEGDSEHTIALAIRKAAQNRHIPIPKITEFEAIKGRGVVARQGGHKVYVGGPRMLELLKITLPDNLLEFGQRASSKGQSVINLFEDNENGVRALAAFSLADMVRPESRDTIQKLHEMKIDVAMLTGDSQAVAQVVADELGIKTYFAEVLPEHKDQKIMDLQRQGKKVAMVGDGVNDAPALSRADVGIAIGSGTDIAIESAGIILINSNPMDVVKIFDLSRASYRKMIQNLMWAAGYNIIALPLAAGVLAPIGFLLSPAVGAILMSLSTVIVAVNAQLLRGHKLAS